MIGAKVIGRNDVLSHSAQWHLLPGQAFNISEGEEGME